MSKIERWSRAESYEGKSYGENGDPVKFAWESDYNSALVATLEKQVEADSTYFLRIWGLGDELGVYPAAEEIYLGEKIQEARKEAVEWLENHPTGNTGLEVVPAEEEIGIWEKEQHNPDTITYVAEAEVDGREFLVYAEARAVRHFEEKNAFSIRGDIRELGGNFTFDFRLGGISVHPDSIFGLPDRAVNNVENFCKEFGTQEKLNKMVREDLEAEGEL
jgi:hypothetical protein